VPRWQPVKPLDIFDPISDADYWGDGRWFKDTDTWEAWFTVLKVIFGLPLDYLETRLFRQCTGRQEPLVEGYKEAWFVVGRKGGKSRCLSLIAVYLAVFKDWSDFLSPGETGTIKIISVDRRQSRVIYNYCKAFLSVASLAHLVEKDTGDELILSNGITIEIQTASYRSVRGYTCVAILCDEISFWYSNEDAANPDKSILEAARPSMSSVPDAILLCASSPYSRKGELWEHFKRYYGDENSDVLIWKADTRTMNPTIRESEITQAYAKDFSWAAAEYGAEFRSDLEQFVQIETVMACVDLGVTERAPKPNTRYFAFCDPSGGGGDAYAVAIAHREGELGILDAVRTRNPPFSPQSVTKEFADLVKSYGIHVVRGDRYGGEFPRELWADNGVIYEPSEIGKSDIYVNLLSLMNSRRVRLIHHQMLINQLVSLERKSTRGSGKDVVDHPPRAHDDAANVASGALLAVGGLSERDVVIRRYLLGPRAA
jgi:hypothetical protein